MLASPFVGVSNDALVLLRRARRRRPCTPGSSAACGRRFDERDSRLFRAFRQRYERIAEGSGSPLARAAVRTGRARARLRPRDPRAARRPAPLREHAQARAPRALGTRSCAAATSKASSASCASRTPVGASELEAVAEEEDTDVIRLMTIHAAKGLEFKVVVVADAGRDRVPRVDEVLCLPDGRLGFKVAHPATGRRLPTTGYEEVKDAEAQAERGRAPPPLLRGDDAGDRPADRLGLDRSEPRVRCGDADRLGARAARPGGARARGRRPARDRAR